MLDQAQPGQSRAGMGSQAPAWRGFPGHVCTIGEGCAGAATWHVGGQEDPGGGVCMCVCQGPPTLSPPQEGTGTVEAAGILKGKTEGGGLKKSFKNQQQEKQKSYFFEKERYLYLQFYFKKLFKLRKRPSWRWGWGGGGGLAQGRAGAMKSAERGALGQGCLEAAKGGPQCPGPPHPVLCLPQAQPRGALELRGQAWQREGFWGQSTQQTFHRDPERLYKVWEI